MIYQTLCLIELFKKKYYKFFLLFIILFVMIVTVSYLSNYEFDIILFESILGTSANYSMFGILWLLFQLLFHCYIAFLFFDYEKNNSFEFTILRASYFKIIIKKILVLIIFVLFFRILFFLLVFLIFRKTISFSFYIFLKNIIIFIIASIASGALCTIHNNIL